MLELKKELALRETVFDSVKKELRDYQKIAQGLENLDPSVFTLELENQRLKHTLHNFIALQNIKSSNIITLKTNGEEDSIMNSCLELIQISPEKCQLFLEGMKQVCKLRGKSNKKA